MQLITAKPCRTHGAILRDDLAWNEYWLWDSDDIMAAVYYNENNEPDGYVIYWIAKEVFHIKDMIFNMKRQEPDYGTSLRHTFP